MCNYVRQEVHILAAGAQRAFNLRNFLKIRILFMRLVQNMIFSAFEINASKTVFAIKATHHVLAIAAIGTPVEKIGIIVSIRFNNLISQFGLERHSNITTIFHSPTIV